MWFLLVPVALAEVPTSVRPVAAPADAPAQFSEWAASRGRPDETLSCRPVWPSELQVCFTVVEGKTRRWVSDRDLTAWAIDLDALVRLVVDRSEAPLAGRPRETRVTDMPATYWLSADADGWDAALLLKPDRIAERIGGLPILVAAPVDGTVLAWRPGDASLDKVLAVGARKIFESQPSGVTAVVHQWDGTSWTAFGEAIPQDQPPPVPPVP